MAHWSFRISHRLIGFWTRLRRPITMGVKAAIFDDEGRILLVRHSYTDGWHMPGGGVQRDETTVEAVIREVKEETGLEVVGTPELRGIIFAPHRGKSDHIMLYQAQVAEHDPRPDEFEILEVGYFAPDDLPEGTTAATRRRLAELLSGEAPPHHW